MNRICLLVLLLWGSAAYAHQPDLSNLMLYEQNGKTLLLIKSSLSAFEGEVDYRFSAKAYQSPEQFKQLVVKSFQQHCLLVINGDTIRFANVQVQLGHETTLFAELPRVPKTITRLHVKNTLFKDMPHNQSELILLLGGLPQKQVILNDTNNQEVQFNVENQQWVAEDVGEPAAALKAIWWAALPAATLLLLWGIIVVEAVKKRWSVGTTA